MKKRLRKIGVTFLAVFMLFLSVVSPLGAGLHFGQSIQCEAAVSPFVLAYDWLMSVFFGIGVTAGGSSTTEAYEEWKKDKGTDSIDDVEAYDQQVREQYEELIVTHSGDASAEINKYLTENFTVNADGTYTPSVSIVKDGKLMVPQNVVKNCTELMDSLTSNCTVDTIKGRKLSFVDGYNYISIPDGSIDLLTEKLGSNIIASVQSVGLEYTKCAYYYDSECRYAVIIPPNSVLCVKGYSGLDVAGCYDVGVIESKYNLFAIKNGHDKSEFDNVNKQLSKYYYYDIAAGSISEVGKWIPLSVMNVSSIYQYGNFSSNIRMINVANSGSTLVNWTLSPSRDYSGVIYNKMYQFAPVVSASVFGKSVDTVAKDVTVDLSDEKVEAITNAKTLDDVINAVDASSAELTEIRDGITDTNKKLEDSNIALAGISGILSSIYNVLKGNSQGTLFDFVSAISVSVVGILSLLENIAKNVLLLADISAAIGTISAMVVSLPKSIADAISDIYPTLDAKSIANAIADVFPVTTAVDIANAIADKFPFGAKDIASAISDTFPALITKLVDALSDAFPYVNIKEVVDGISIPTAKDIADAVAKVIPAPQEIANKLNIPLELAKVITAILSLPQAISSELAKILNITVALPLEALKAITWNVSIDGLVQAIVDAIVLALTTVLLPDAGTLKKHFNTLNTEFKETFAFLYLPLNAIIQVRDTIQERPDHFKLKFPEIKYNDLVFFKGYEINVTLEFGKYQTCYDLYILFTNLIFTLGLFNYFAKEFEKMAPL